MIEETLRPFSKLSLWLSSKQNRLRLKGARIEVILFLVTRKPEVSILLAKSVYHNIWMPPQEGVNYQESFESAIYRCLDEECSLPIFNSDLASRKQIYIRSINYSGVLDLHKSRHGEREVASDIHGTILEGTTLKKKAYWVATILIEDKNTINPKPNKIEILELEWFNFTDAREIIEKSNHKDKGKLLVKALNKCELDITGGLPPGSYE